MDYIIKREDYLEHHGVKGMKWGVRRYQNKDGSYTKLGKKHKTAAIKRLHDERSNYLKTASAMKSYVETNREALKKSKEDDKKTGETSWRTHSLTDAYKAAGREYINAIYHAKIYESYIKAYDNDSIKVGQDYITKKLRDGSVKLTDSGRAKENELMKQVYNDFSKKYAKEIKEYS